MFGFVCQANANDMLYNWHDWLVFLKVWFSLLVHGYSWLNPHWCWHCTLNTFSTQSCIHFSPSSCINDGRIGPLHKVFSSASQRFQMGLRSGLCGGQTMCENDVSCSLNHFFTVWAGRIVALSSWNIHLGRKKSIVQSPVCMFPYKLKPFFQMINVFFHATQLQVPIPWVLFPLCALTLSIKHSCEFYCWFLRFDFTKHLGDFSDHISIYISFHVLIGRWTVLNSILIVSAVSLDVFFSCCWPINWPRVRSIFSHDHRVCCLTNEKLITVSLRFK